MSSNDTPTPAPTPIVIQSGQSEDYCLGFTGDAEAGALVVLVRNSDHAPRWFFDPASGNIVLAQDTNLVLDVKGGNNTTLGAQLILNTGDAKPNAQVWIWDRDAPSLRNGDLAVANANGTVANNNPIILAQPIVHPSQVWYLIPETELRSGASSTATPAEAR